MRAKKSDKNRPQRSKQSIPLGISKKELRAIALSHGFYDLDPWVAQPGGKRPYSTRLTRAFDTPRGTGAFEMAIENRKVVLRVLRGKRKTALTVAQRCLGLEIGLERLWKTASEMDEFRWLKDLKLGRHLLSPTLFEDAFKVLSTTNITWSGTKRIIARTVERYGRKIGGLWAFPRPAQLIHASENQLRQDLGCGYRAAGILDLCTRALRHPNLYEGDDWQGLSSEAFAEELISIKGLGKASVSYLGRFYGKPVDFTIDSWVVKRARELWNVKRDIPGFAAERYECFGELGPMVFWFELSKYWHELEERDGAVWEG
jgi:hypothetical protein